jgi:hypothetical protein
MDLNLEKIAAREKEIATAIKDLEREAADLAAARRVLERFAGNGIGRDLEKPPDKVPRPDGAPSTFEMVREVLRDAYIKGETDGIDSKELVKRIREKYWPGLTTGQVLPTIYGFLKNDRLKKDKKGRWTLPI